MAVKINRRFGWPARLTVAFAACVVCAIALFLCLGDRKGSPVNSPRLHSVVLANRTISPSSFGEPSSPCGLSPRGTAAYALACAVPVTHEIRELAASFGARVIGYLPKQALLVEASPSAISAALGDSRFVGATAYQPLDKVRAGVTEGDITISPLAECDRNALADFVVGEGGTVCMTGPSMRGSFGATVSAGTLAALARHGDVLWIDRRTQPRVVNDFAVCDTGVTNAWNALGLTGKGQVIATADSGIDTGDKQSLHEDFTNRVVEIVNMGGCTTADYNGHGTHTAGTIGGSGAKSYGQYKGVAYEAKLYIQACGTNVTGRGDIIFENAETYDDIFAAGIPSGAYIHSDSWGGEHNGVYEYFCQGLDDVAWNNPDLLVVVAAGNGGSGAKTICSPGVAKNALTVGNSHSSSPRSSAGPETINSSSSRGPCADGRIKPDITAPGTSIVSCRTSMRPGLSKYNSSDWYTSMTGTSMATPHVAGCAALLRQWLLGRQEFADVLPSAALLKAILTGGAAEMKIGYSRMVQGFGRVDFAETIAPSNRCVKLHDRIPFAVGKCMSYSFTLTNAAPFDVQLVWIDYPAEPSAGAAIVNDLDLVVVSKTTGERWYGNDVVGGDRTNTVESVRIPSAEPGEYKVMVIGDSVAYDSTEGGAAALYVRGAFAEGDGEEATPKWNVSVSATGPDALDKTGLSPSAGETVSMDDFVRVTLSAPHYMTATNSLGTPVALHALEGFSVVGVDSWTSSDDGETAVISLVTTNNAAVAWNYSHEADFYALYALLAAQDTYMHRNQYTCYIATSNNELYNTVPLVDDAIWIESGSDVKIETPGEMLADEFKFDTLYYKRTGFMGSTKIRPVSLFSTPFVLKLGAVAIVETDADPSAYDVDSNGAMPSSFDFTMDSAKDVIGYYWDASRTVDGSTLPYWWYMRNLYCAQNGEYPALSGDSGAYTADDGDPDGDGFGNRTEYDECTVPVDPLSFPFRILSFSPTNIVWLGGKSATYAIETATSPDRTAEWTESASNIPGSGSVTNSAPMHIVPSNHAIFFRIKAR